MVFGIIERNVPIGRRAGLVGFVHRFIGLKRFLLRQSVLLWIDRCARKGLSSKAVTDLDGTVEACLQCGFAVARVSFPNGWSWQGCSAVELPPLVGNLPVQVWTQELPALQSAGCELQTTGH